MIKKGKVAEKSMLSILLRWGISVHSEQYNLVLISVKRITATVFVSDNGQCYFVET